MRDTLWALEDVRRSLDRHNAEAAQPVPSAAQRTCTAVLTLSSPDCGLFRMMLMAPFRSGTVYSMS